MEESNLKAEASWIGIRSDQTPVCGGCFPSGFTSEVEKRVEGNGAKATDTRGSFALFITHFISGIEDEKQLPADRSLLCPSFDVWPLQVESGAGPSGLAGR